MQRRLLICDIKRLSPKAATYVVTFNDILFSRRNARGLLARADDKRQKRRWRRSVNLYGLDLEQITSCSGRIVQPRDSFHMLGARVGDNPYGDLRFDRRQGGDQFTKMIVIAPRQLVFDDNRVARLVLRDKIYAKHPS